MRYFTSFIFSVLVTAGHAAAQEETPARPIDRIAPPYPVSCMPAAVESAEPQSVTLMFDISDEGVPQDVRVRESTDPCFDEAALVSARRWRYEPARRDGRAVAQPDMEVTVTFVLNEETTAADYDARPLVRHPPRYPERCMGRAKREESVLVTYDVSKDGRTENIEATESTFTCLNQSAINAVKKWEYAPQVVNGEPQTRRGVETVVTYILEYGNTVPPEEKFRLRVRHSLKRAQNQAGPEKNPAKALLTLKDVEESYGETFSRRERAAFYQVRAGVRIEAMDYAGALDDLRMLQRVGPEPEMQASVANTISQLEAALGVGPDASPIGSPQDGNEEIESQ